MMEEVVESSGMECIKIEVGELPTVGTYPRSWSLEPTSMPRAEG